MRVRSLHVRGLRSIADQTLDDLPPITYVVGPNSAGKSNIAFALRMFLFVHLGGHGPERSDVCAFDFQSPPLVELKVVPTTEEKAFIMRNQLLAGISGVDPAPLLRLASKFESIIETLKVGAEISDDSPRGGQLQAVGFIPQINDTPVTEFVKNALPDLLEGADANPGGVGLANYLPNMINRNILGGLVVPRVLTLGPMRHPRPRMSPTGIERIQPDASDIGNAIFLEASNRTERFLQLERWFRDVFPEASDVLTAAPLPRMQQGNELRLGVREEGLPDMVPADAMSSGMLEALSILSLIAFSPEGSFITLEEPEAHFHGSALESLMRIVREQSRRRQFLIITHSEEVVGLQTEMSSVWNVAREPAVGSRFLRGRDEIDSDLMHKLLHERPPRPARDGNNRPTGSSSAESGPPASR